MPEQMSLFNRDGWILAIEGMTRAINHADRVSEENLLIIWSNAAREILARFISQNRDRIFTAEDVRDYADRVGLFKPPTERAWGMIIRSASKANVIGRDPDLFRVARRPGTHSMPLKAWRSFATNGDLRVWINKNKKPLKLDHAG